MSHLRLVPAPADDVAEVDDLPRISLRLLMAASGRCSCDDCLWAYRRGNRDAGNVRIGCRSSQLIAVR